MTSSFHFAPLTPDQAKQLEFHRLSEILNVSFDESSSQEKDKQQNLFTSASEEIDNHFNDILQNIVDSSSTVISTPLKGKNNAYEEDEQGIDLNKTPEQKTPKRRKHRPKVVIEGKPKRTPKPATPKTNALNGNFSGKRKYVRKKGLKTLEAQQENVVNEGTVTVEPAAKSCRRALNFDLKIGTSDASQNRMDSHQLETHQESKRPFNLNLDSHDTEICTGINSVSGTLAVQIEQAGQQNVYTEKNQQAIGTCDLPISTNQMLAAYLSSAEQCAPPTALAKAKDHVLNVIARNMNMRNAIPCQNSGSNGYSQVHQHICGEEINQDVFQADSLSENFQRTRQLMWQSTSQLVAKDVASYNEKRGLKRAHCHTVEQIHSCTQSMMGPQILSHEKLFAGENNSGSNNFVGVYSETHKKINTINGLHATMSSMLSSMKPVREFSRQVDTGSLNSGSENHGTSQINGRLLNCSFGRAETSKKINSAVYGMAGDCRISHMGTMHNLQRQHASSTVQSYTALMAEKEFHPSQVHDFNSLAAVRIWNQISTPKQAPTIHDQQGIVTSNANVSTKKRTVEPDSSNHRSTGMDDVLHKQQNDAFGGYHPFPVKEKRGKLRKQKFSVSVDDITFQLETLHIYGRDNEEVDQVQHALVPYNGISTIVPYEGFNPIKKRKPRPKVDLDPESDRIWRLLMGKEGNESTAATDKDKEKWWEEERRVFRGRADSFIARMHLVQGDRRFSPWKGSVVDSVIGVFLTQNVSDHLSSSAFMSLAAKFPLKSTTTETCCYQNGTSVLMEEPDIQLLGSIDHIKHHENKGQRPVYNEIFVTSCEPPDQKMDNLFAMTRSTENDYNRISNEEIISSRSSLYSSNCKISEQIRSNTGSNLEEHRRTGYNPSKNCSQTKMLLKEVTVSKDFHRQVGGSSLLDGRSNQWHQNSEDPRLGKVNDHGVPSAFPYLMNSHAVPMRQSILSSSNFQLNMTPGSGVLDSRYLGLSGEDSLPFFPSTPPGTTKVNSVNHMSRWMGHMAVSKTPAQQNGAPRVQAPMLGPLAFLGKHPTQQGYLQPGVQTESNQHTSNNYKQERSMTFHLNRAVVTEPMGPAETLTTGNTGTMQHIFHDPMFRRHTLNTKEQISELNKQNRSKGKSEANAKDPSNSSGNPFNGAGTSVQAKKGKAEGEKKTTFDWDSLRQQAQSNGKREKSKNAMDSLNYEAVRCANVKEISDAIKERGMNNMLADRIKAFLNRLVDDHGSIDLEWVRDVPPDKAKDYLLSIRGLGLKSVECVRLLTLHHLAFPVDTNVGRIAVRLGWVPLQPLPESLQLHLLELYPVLETIQKYLWPRLCKLDQRTLYELHYQMITFGKVFCTKSKPNCNACPMRGECRHFASAFASARLALPAPEEKSIVSSAVPIGAANKPMASIKPTLLLEDEKTPSNDAGYIHRKCEPVVEEPTTPEQEATEGLESNIEDEFYEDPDEIPTIKLNIEEFTMNLHNYLQDNMELQEGDVSKALVALNREVASIPTPKLKNVNRLRTEHQVYELPDSHPLLDRLDPREPDDPSPYLLAIWTPGETADSIQPPESRCGAQEAGQLCDDQTCFSCNSIREANSQTVRGTLLLPCRTAMRGSFPLNGTYFQVNEMFADHESSISPIAVPRSLIWNLPRRTVYFGTSVSTIFKGLSTEGIQLCFWRGFVCVRGFDVRSRAPRPLMARLHFPASKLVKTKKGEEK